MLQRAVEQQKAIDSWLGTNPQIGSVRLGEYALTQAHWQVLQNICMLLQPFDNATKELSGSKYPTLSLVMPVYVQLIEYMEATVASLDDDNEL